MVIDKGVWDRFLLDLAGSRPDLRAFVARNFILEEGAPPERVASYLRASEAEPVPSDAAWRAFHDAYLSENVHRPPAGDGLHLFGRDPTEDPHCWADDLRDLLGLGHYDPSDRGGPIDVLVFRYPVALVPRLRLGGLSLKHPLLPPTVLDGSHSPFFCPAPRTAPTGYALHLGAGRGHEVREVVHPSVPYRANHLWRVGTIRRPVDLAAMPRARSVHVLKVRAVSQRPDFAVSTDRDLWEASP